jgi:hypothetical protein
MVYEIGYTAKKRRKKCEGMLELDQKGRNKAKILKKARDELKSQGYTNIKMEILLSRPSIGNVPPEITGPDSPEVVEGFVGN